MRNFSCLSSTRNATVKVFLISLLFTMTLAISTTHHDKPEEAKPPKMAKNQMRPAFQQHHQPHQFINYAQTLNSSSSSSKLTDISERQKRLLPYMTFYLEHSFNRPHTQSSHNSHDNKPLAQYQQPPSVLQQYHNKFTEHTNGFGFRPQQQQQPGSRQKYLTPFLESNSLPGPFLPMRGPPELMVTAKSPPSPSTEYVPPPITQPTLSSASYGAIYNRLSQLKQQQQQQQKHYQENYNNKRYKPVYVVTSDESKQILNSKPSFQKQVTYVSDTQSAEYDNNYNPDKYENIVYKTFNEAPIKNVQYHDIYKQPNPQSVVLFTAPHQDHVLPATNEDRKQYHYDQKLYDIQKRVKTTTSSPPPIIVVNKNGGKQNYVLVQRKLPQPYKTYGLQLQVPQQQADNNYFRGYSNSGGNLRIISVHKEKDTNFENQGSPQKVSLKGSETPVVTTTHYNVEENKNGKPQDSRVEYKPPSTSQKTYPPVTSYQELYNYPESELILNATHEQSATLKSVGRQTTVQPQNSLYNNNFNYEVYESTSSPNNLPQDHEDGNSLNLLLKKLQDINALPNTLTPDNIDNSIRTLVKILSSLKKQKSQNSIVQTSKPSSSSVVVTEALDENYDDDDDSNFVNGEVPVPGTVTQIFPDNTPEGGTPGTPGIDYPALNSIPPTSFNCKTQRYKGFFGDPETNCQVWHYCDLNGGQASFLCPNGTIFSQVALTCDWWYNVKCSNTAQQYVLNERLYKYILPLSPKFPEDYSGPLVDRYLALKFQEMEEKMKKERKTNKEDSSDADETTEQDEDSADTSTVAEENDNENKIAIVTGDDENEDSSTTHPKTGPTIIHVESLENASESENENEH